MKREWRGGRMFGRFFQASILLPHRSNSSYEACGRHAGKTRHATFRFTRVGGIAVSPITINGRGHLSRRHDSRYGNSNRDSSIRFDGTGDGNHS